MKRKTFFSFLGMCLIALLATAVSFLSTSCENLSMPQQCTCEPMDSVEIAAKMYAITNPSFASVQEVTGFQSELIEQYSVDEIFRLLPQNVLRNIATVCLKRDSRITKADIILEYRANYEIYNNLNSDTTTTAKPKQPTIAMEEQQLPAETHPNPINVSYYYKIDTMNGKPVKVLVKEEYYESK